MQARLAQLLFRFLSATMLLAAGAVFPGGAPDDQEIFVNDPVGGNIVLSVQTEQGIESVVSFVSLLVAALVAAGFDLLIHRAKNGGVFASAERKGAISPKEAERHKR